MEDDYEPLTDEFVQKTREVIDQAFDFARAQETPAVMVFAVGTDSKKVKVGKGAGQIAHMTHGMSAVDIANTLANMMIQSPEAPMSLALHALLHMDAPELHGHSKDDSDEFHGNKGDLIDL